MQGDKGRDMTESKTKAAGEDVAEDLAKLREDIAALKGDLARLAKSLRGEAGEVSDEARQLYEKWTKEGERAAKAAVRELEDRPLIVLLVAFAIGFIGGRLLPR
jgi:hypothetical protein